MSVVIGKIKSINVMKQKKIKQKKMKQKMSLDTFNKRFKEKKEYKSGIYNPPKHNFKNIKILNFESNIIRQVIGSKGKNLIEITEKSGCSYIWHNRKNNTIEFYADRIYKIKNAEYLLFNLIIKVIEHIINSGYKVYYSSYIWYLNNKHLI